MSDSPLPLAVGHIVSRDSKFFLFLTGIGLIGLIASFHGILIVASRSIMELGRVRYVPAILGVVHPRTKTPVAALIANMCVGLFALFTGRTSDIILISVFGALTLYVLSTASVLRLHKTPFYPYTPIIALVLSSIALVAMVWEHPKLAGIYAAIVVGSWIAFVIFVPADRRTTFEGSAS
jgi:ethanolamine permease